VVTYDSPVLEYSLRLPAGYRRSECLSLWQSQDPSALTDVFTPISAADEKSQDRSHAGNAGMDAHVVSVTATNADAKTALEWAAVYGSYGGIEQHEQRTIAGHDASRTTVRGTAVLYVVRAGDRLFLIATSLENPLPGGLLDDMASTFRVSATAPIAMSQATLAVIPQSARDAASRVAAALERGDAAAIAPLITPRCWLETWSASSGAIGRAVQPFLSQLRSQLQGGLRITVDPEVRVAQGLGPSGLQFYMSSRWTQSGRTTTNNLYLREIDTQWYWGGVEAVAISGP